MPFQFLGQRGMRSGWARLADDDWTGRRLHRDRSRLSDQAQPDLAAASQFDIDLREKLSVEQRAVLDAMTAVDPKAHAQGVEAVLGAGVLHPRELQRVDHAMHRHRTTAAFLELVIQKAEVEARIVRDERRV